MTTKKDTGYEPFDTGIPAKPMTAEESRDSLKNLPKGDVEQSIRDLNDGRGK